MLLFPSLKFFCENLNLVNTYDKTNLTDFVLSLCEKNTSGVDWMVVLGLSVL